jgi:XTP/dITP diphosphohydrolase
VSRRLILASANLAKLREFSQMFEGSAWNVVPQDILGVDSVAEQHSTFVENALAKARYAAARTGAPALADDSGLCVESLGGAPGVWSARLAGEGADDQSNNAELLRRMVGVPQRRAHYTCVLVAIRSVEDAEPIIVDARWRGEIADAPRGSGGFGYDPLFYIASLGLTAAELEAAQKNAISHRGLAVRALAARLADWN